MEEVAGGWMKLLDVDHHSLYSKQHYKDTRVLEGSMSGRHEKCK